jgi:hypothetical protein
MHIKLTWVSKFPRVWTSKGDGAINIHDVAPIITYLQINVVLIGLTPKEWEGENTLYYS